MERFGQFYSENKEKLFGYLLRKSGSTHLAADLVQESYTRYIERYRHQELSVALLFTIARNIFLDHVRNQRPQADIDDIPAGMADDQEHLFIRREESRQILAALQQLDEEDRDILSLIASSGLTYREIATIKNCSEGSIKVRVHRARQKLRAILPAESL